MYRYREQVVNEETGEIVFSKPITLNKQIKIKKIMVDNMLKKAKTIEDLDSEMLYEWCRITKHINEYGQIQLLGLFRDKATEKKNDRRYYHNRIYNENYR